MAVRSAGVIIATLGYLPPIHGYYESGDDRPRGSPDRVEGVVRREGTSGIAERRQATPLEANVITVTARQ